MLIKLKHIYLGRETGREVIPQYVYKDWSIQETFIVYTRPGGQEEEIRLSAFRQFYKLKIENRIYSKNELKNESSI